MKKLALSLLAMAGLAACGTTDTGAGEGAATVRVGIVGSVTEVWDSVAERVADHGIQLEIIQFSDFNTPNTALAQGEIEMNAFQHQFFLDTFNREAGTDIVSIGNTFNAPLGIYSEALANPSDIADGAQVAIPNDVTNGGRALLLLQAAGLIEVDAAAGLTPSLSDVVSNPRNLEIVELAADQTARALQDVAMSVINSGMAIEAGLVPEDDAIFLEPVDENARPYVNIIAVRGEDADNEIFQTIVDVFQTQETIDVAAEFTPASIPAWEAFGRK